MISIIDFDDSFTFNLASELKILAPGHSIHIVTSTETINTLSDLCQSDEPHLVILGPGPGHPQKYDKIHELLGELISKKNIFILGICLGHQILARYFGFEVGRCESPIHGQTKKLELSQAFSKKLGLPRIINPQFYNSLAVLNKDSNLLTGKNINKLVQNDEVLIFQADRLLSYQFHPESIGTSDRSSYFKYPLDFLL